MDIQSADEPNRMTLRFWQTPEGRFLPEAKPTGQVEALTQLEE